jgi:hypothetical protein
MRKLTELEQYLVLVDRLVQTADKGELAECARLLAMNVAHYEIKYGEMPLQDRLVMTYAGDELNDQQNELVIKGMETLVGVLGRVIQGLDDKIEH